MAMQFWRDGSYFDSGNGIQVQVSGDPLLEYVTPDDPMNSEFISVEFPKTFAASVHHALSYIRQTHVGQLIMPVLENTPGLIQIGACSPSVGNRIMVNNQGSAFNQVANELLSGASMPGPSTKAALALAVKAAAAPFFDKETKPHEWLAQWVAMSDHLPWPENGPTFNPASVNFRPLTAYLFSTNPFDPPPADWGNQLYRGHLTVAMISLLEKHSPAGAGSGSAIGWNAFPAYKPNAIRPPAVGLAHELIHAYFALRGQQPGYDDAQNFSCVMFEYKCVGLGPWNQSRISENAIRAEWGGVVRNEADPLFKLNKINPGRRPCYGI